MMYLEGVLVLNYIGMFELFQDSNLSTDFLLSYQFAVHLLDSYLPPCFHVPAPIDLPIGTLPDTILLRENILSHLHLHFIIHC